MPIRKSVATRYAKALVDVAMERQIHEKIGTQLNDFKDLLATQKELYQVFENPAFPSDVRKHILKQVTHQLGAEKIFENFLLLLLERNRMRILPDIARSFVDLVDERLGVMAAEVKTATELSEENRELLRTRLMEISGKDVKLSFSVDKALIGGVLLQIGSTIFDGSIRGQLEEMKKRITRE